MQRALTVRRQRNDWGGILARIRFRIVGFCDHHRAGQKIDVTLHVIRNGFMHMDLALCKTCVQYVVRGE